MSTAIYQGFQIATSSLPVALEIVNAFRPTLERKARQILQRFIDTAAKAIPSMAGLCGSS